MLYEFPSFRRYSFEIEGYYIHFDRFIFLSDSIEIMANYISDGESIADMSIVHRGSRLECLYLICEYHDTEERRMEICPIFSK